MRVRKCHTFRVFSRSQVSQPDYDWSWGGGRVVKHNFDICGVYFGSRVVGGFVVESCESIRKIIG